MTETALDNLFDHDYQWLRTIALNSVERLVDVLAKENVLPRTDSDPKPGEIDDEPERRVATLQRVKAAQVVGALLAEVATDVTAQEAANAVWLGASLADLGSASGSTRQAARKRWPDLGQIYRTRRWLSGHHEAIRLIARRLIEVQRYIWPKSDVTPAMIAAAYEGLINANNQIREDFESGSMVAETEISNVRIIRWQRLGELVDRHIRDVVGLIEPVEDEADYAISGAIGLLAHFDSVNPTPMR